MLLKTMLLICLGSSILLISCQSQPAGKAATRDTIPPKASTVMDNSIPGNFSSQHKLHFDSTRITAFLRAFPEFSMFREELNRFYSGRSYAYAWFDDQGLIESSQDLYNRISNMTDEGIPFNVPYYDRYKDMIESRDSLATDGPDTETELMITAQYFNYAHKVWAGLPESTTKNIQWYVPRKKLSYDQLLDSMLKAQANGIAIKEPVHRQYAMLKEYLSRFRQLEKEGKWVTIPAQKRSYRSGDSADVIALVRKRLFYSRDLAEDNGSSLFDTTLSLGVRSFQQRFGLKEDGVIGPGMVRELGAPINIRIRQLIVNMERARWVNDDPKGDYLLVNIPEFKLHVFASDTQAWACNVVVGKEVNKTVIFSGDLKYVVFSPYWNVPPSIYSKEIVPGMRRNPNYLAQHNMERTADGVREKPGPKNSLGLVKFLFPNSYNIYLHDSPAKSLFNEEKRTFSHGCIRVAEPKRLAIHLLRNDPAWDEAKITAAMNKAVEKTVTLKTNIPVSIVYFTAWVDEKGKLNFRDDVYKRDARMAELLFEKSGKTGQ
jgi:murein L,D-transpeptidase YcbB/YkuD